MEDDGLQAPVEKRDMVVTYESHLKYSCLAGIFFLDSFAMSHSMTD